MARFCILRIAFIACLVLAVGMLPSAHAEITVEFLGEDTVTGGDWRQDLGLGPYGDCYVLLPDPQCTGFPERCANDGSFTEEAVNICEKFPEPTLDVLNRQIFKVLDDQGTRERANTFWLTSTPSDCDNMDCGFGEACGIDHSACVAVGDLPAGAQWNPCEGTFKAGTWDDGDVLTPIRCEDQNDPDNPTGITPPMSVEFTIDFEGSTEVAFYFLNNCVFDNEASCRTQNYRLYVDDTLKDSGIVVFDGHGTYLVWGLNGLVGTGTKIRFETEWMESDPEICSNPNFTENAHLSGVFLSNCEPEPECDIKVTKTCEILPPPPGPEVSTCDDLKDVTGLTMIWRGPDDDPDGVVNIKTELGQVITGIKNGDIVFLNTPKDKTGNDVDVFLTGSVTGMSRFHISCSDNNMNGFEDCEKLQGDGKSNDSNLINLWEFGGMTGEKGQFTCPNAQPDLNGFPTETDECEFTPQPDGGNCDDIKDVTALTLVWNGPDGLDIETETGQVITGIKKGNVIVLDTPKDDTGNDVEVFLSGSVNGESKFHISCSDDDMDGPEDCGTAQGNGKGNDDSLNNQWLFGGMTGEKGSFGCPGVPGGPDSAEVVYGIRVENPGEEVNVQIVDVELGINQTETIPANDFFELVTDPITIMPDNTNEFTNTVVVTAETSSGAQCEASDSVTVKRNPPPPPPVSCSDIKDITAVSVVWTGDETVNVVMESGEMFENVMTGNKITFQEADTGNDVEMSIFEAGTSMLLGESKFHVSCSDEDMNGSEDCGKPQGDGKKDDDRLNNGWLLDGMTGENGSFDCNLLNTGVVAPSGGAGVTGAETLDLRDDKKVKWELTNNGNQDVFITWVKVTWPEEHGQVKKFKLAGDFAKDVFDTDSPTIVPDEKAFENDPNKRKLKKGEHKNLEIEFTDKFKNHDENDFTLSVEFDNGDIILNFPVPDETL